VIDSNFYSTHGMMTISPEMPCVIKVGHAHRGMGKIQVKDQQEFRDVSTIIALHQDYCTAEEFISSDYGIRVQKIGTHYRVYKKIWTGSSWKSQFGGSGLVEIPVEDKHKLWADECAKVFGGMELLSVDALHGKDGKDYILELNGTASGFQTKDWVEDTQYLIELVLDRLDLTFGKSVRPQNTNIQNKSTKEEDE